MRRALSFHPRNTLALVHGVECEHIGAVQFPNKLGVQEEHLDDDDVLQADLPPPLFLVREEWLCHGLHREWSLLSFLLVCK